MTHPREREYPGLSVSGRMLQDNTRCQPKTHNHNKHPRLSPTQQTNLPLCSSARNPADTTNCRPPYAVSSLHASPLFIAAVQQQGCATPRPRYIPPRASPTGLYSLYTAVLSTAQHRTHCNSKLASNTTCCNYSLHYVVRARKERRSLVVLNRLGRAPRFPLA
jgi:hypothetical protein